MKFNKIDHHYVSKTIQSGNQFEVELYPVFSKKEINKYRIKKKPSKAYKKNLNEKNARKYFIRLINNNFDENDYVMHLTYSNENLPDSIEEAEKNVSNFIRKINYRRKKLGLENSKYVYVTEFDKDKKIRVHHHMIVEGTIDRLLLKKLWTLGTRIKIEELEPDEYGLTGLANYLAKDPKGKKRWKSSKNLKKPLERKAFTRFSKRKISRMIENPTLISKFMLESFKSKDFLDYEIRYNKVNRLFYIYVRMKIKDKINFNGQKRRLND
ncbi:MAG: hypothetical protein ACLTLP_09490 [Faecalibacillus intestinalis]